MTATGAQIVIFGLTGDLARKKLLPALYHLVAGQLLPEATSIIGVSRRAVTAQDIFTFMHDDPAYDSAVLHRLEAKTQLFQMDLADPAGYQQLKNLLDQAETAASLCAHRLFYLSMPPQVFGPVIDLLGTSGLGNGCPHGTGESRLLIEKPFGFDLASAEELVVRIAKQFNQEQVFRIDHYLAKATTQQLLQSHIPGAPDRQLWNAAHLERITITASETIGIEGRAAFYEQTGALRDIIQNHLLQLLALVAIEPPAELTAERLHAEKLELLQAVGTIAPNEVWRDAVRGQYDGYRAEVGNPDSLTETFAAIRLHINSPRWQGVPIVLQAGKALDHKLTEIALQFKPNTPGLPPHHQHTVRIDPPEDTTLRHPDAYERVLADAIHGDRTLFTTSAETIECWRIIDFVLEEWAKTGDGLIIYQPGTPAAKLS
jgi:glucose-6-phosphate 1-dehydrogenase